MLRLTPCLEDDQEGECATEDDREIFCFTSGAFCVRIIVLGIDIAPVMSYFPSLMYAFYVHRSRESISSTGTLSIRGNAVAFNFKFWD